MIVKLPVLEIVTLREARNPATRAGVVPLPDDKLPVEVISTVPVKTFGPLLQVLLFASLAVTLILNDVPAI